MKERLDNFIIENRDNILDDIAKLVNIESFCGDRNIPQKRWIMCLTAPVKWA